MIYYKNTYRWASLFAILSLIILFGFLSGCSTIGKKKEPVEFIPGAEWIEDMRARIEEAIEDPAKKTKMLALVDQVEKELLEMDRAIQKLYSDISTKGQNYNATPEEFRNILLEFEDDRKVVRDRIIDIRFKVKDLSTPEEWEKLTDYKRKKGLYKQAVRQPSQ